MTNKWWVLAAVACGTFMATLDSSIVNIALPTLSKDLSEDLPSIKWVVIVYLLVITCMILPFGRLSDQFGRKRVFGIGFMVFTLGSLLCGVSPGLPFLIFSRILQGFGASMLMANGPAIITSNFPGEERGKALGTLAMVVSAGLISGPAIGGILISHLGWRSIFLVNFPVGLLGTWLARKYVKEDIGLEEKRPFDWVGAFLQTLFLMAFILIFEPPHISISGSLPYSIPRLGIVIFALVAMIAFIKNEKSAVAPIFDLTLLKNQTFWTANLAGFLMFVAYSSVAVLMPFFLEEQVSYSTDQAGLMMTAIPLAIFVVAPFSGRLSDRFGSQELSVLGALFLSMILFIMAGTFGGGMNPNSTLPEMIVALSVVGLATGLFQSPNNNAIMGSVPENRLSTASAFLATVRNLGLVTGTGIATAVFSWQKSISSDSIAAFRFTFLISGLLAVAAMISSFGKARGAFWNQKGAK